MYQYECSVGYQRIMGKVPNFRVSITSALDSVSTMTR